MKDMARCDAGRPEGHTNNQSGHADDKVMKRRQREWKACMMGEKNAYFNTDLPDISMQYGDILGVEIDNERITSTNKIPHHVLESVRDELVTLLQCSHVLKLDDNNGRSTNNKRARSESISLSNETSRQNQNDDDDDDNIIIITTTVEHLLPSHILHYHQ